MMQPNTANLQGYNFSDYGQQASDVQRTQRHMPPLYTPANPVFQLPVDSNIASYTGSYGPVSVFDIGRIFDASHNAPSIPLARIGVPTLTRATIRGHDFIPLLLGTVFATPGNATHATNRLVPSLYEYETGQCFVLPVSTEKDDTQTKTSQSTGYQHIRVAERIREIKWIEETDIFVTAYGKIISTYKWAMDTEESIMGGAVLSATESNLHASDIRTLDTESFSKRIISGGFDGQLYITALERSGQSSGHVLSKYNSSAMDSANISTGTILRQRRFPSVISSVSLFSGGQTGAVTTDNGSVMLIDTRSPRLIAFQYDEKVTTFGERKAPLYTHVFSSDAQAYLGYDGGEIRILDTRVGDIVGRRKDSVLKAIGDLSLSANGSLCATGYGGVSFSNASASNLDWERQSSHCHVSTDAMGGLETTSGAWLELENGKSQFFVADDCGHLSVFNDPYEQIVSPDRHY